MAEWIDVNVRLPEDEQDVLTIDSCRECRVAFYEKSSKKILACYCEEDEYYKTQTRYERLEGVTHWMLLPKPPCTPKEG